MQLLIQNMKLYIRQRCADYASAALSHVVKSNRPVSHVHRGFRDAIHIHNSWPLIPSPFEPAAQACQFQSLAPQDHHAQRQLRVSGRFVGLHQLAECRRRLVEHGHALLSEQLMKSLRRPAGPVRHDHQSSAIEECPPYFPYREIEGMRMKKCPHIVLAKRLQGLHGLHQPDNVVMRHQASFGLARRAGRIDDVGKVLRAGVDRKILLRLPRNRVPFAIQAYRAGSASGQRGKQMLLRQKNLHTRVFEEESDSFLRVDRVDGQIRAPGFQDSNQPHDEFKGALRIKTHYRFRPNAQAAQIVCQLVGPCIQFAIGQMLIVEYKRHAVRCTLHLPLKQFMQAELGLIPPSVPPCGRQVSGFGRC